MNERVQMGTRVAPHVTPHVTTARRVRHDARDGLAVMAFSMVSSVTVALFFRLLLELGK